MRKKKTTDMHNLLESELSYLKLPFINKNFKALTDEAASEQLPHIEYLNRLIQGEAEERRNRAIARRIQAARFPVVKTMEQFDWGWPKKINRPQIQNLFSLNFMQNATNAIFIGGVGLGKSHITTALGMEACLRGNSVLFASAVNVINALAAAQVAGKLKHEMKKYIRPSLLILDELGYLPMDKAGADLLFQIISHRYERGSLIITTNRAFKDWPETFNNDSALTAAILDRLLHHAETLLIEGDSYRMKDRIEL